MQTPASWSNLEGLYLEWIILILCLNFDSCEYSVTGLRKVCVCVCVCVCVSHCECVCVCVCTLQHQFIFCVYTYVCVCVRLRCSISAYFVYTCICYDKRVDKTMYSSTLFWTMYIIFLCIFLEELIAWNHLEQKQSMRLACEGQMWLSHFMSYNLGPKVTTWLINWKKVCLCSCCW